MRTYQAQARQYVDWCSEQGVFPAQASEDDVKGYRSYLADANSERTSIGTKLAMARRLYEAARRRCLRRDNPAAGTKVPRNHTSHEERVKFLPCEGLRRMLEATAGDSIKDRCDRAILALLWIHDHRVAEVAALKVDGLNLGGGTVKVTGKGIKTRILVLIPRTLAVLSGWLRYDQRWHWRG